MDLLSMCTVVLLILEADADTRFAVSTAFFLQTLQLYQINHRCSHSMFLV